MRNAKNGPAVKLGLESRRGWKLTITVALASLGLWTALGLLPPKASPSTYELHAKTAQTDDVKTLFAEQCAIYHTARDA